MTSASIAPAFGRLIRDGVSLALCVVSSMRQARGLCGGAWRSSPPALATEIDQHPVSTRCADALVVILRALVVRGGPFAASGTPDLVAQLPCAAARIKWSVRRRGFLLIRGQWILPATMAPAAGDPMRRVNRLKFAEFGVGTLSGSLANHLSAIGALAASIPTWWLEQSPLICIPQRLAGPREALTRRESSSPDMSFYTLASYLLSPIGFGDHAVFHVLGSFAARTPRLSRRWWSES